jgi:peptide/nickel transport system substrate-binding protein
LDVAQIDAASWQHFLRNTDLQLASFSGTRTVYLAFNLKQHPFDNKTVRKAVALAIDKNTMIEKLYEGFAEKATSDFVSSSWAYNPQAVWWPYDPKQSINMLQSAGISNLAFSILTIKDYQDQALVIADNLRNAGIKTEVHMAEYATLRQRYLKKGQFQTCLLSRSTGPDPECILNWGTGGSFNFCGFKDRHVDELLDVGRRSMDMSQRKHTYEEIQAILAEEQPFVFILQPKLLIAHQKDVAGVSSRSGKPLPWDNPVFYARNWEKRTQ